MQNFSSISWGDAMNILVIYDSYFGNTEKIAMAMVKSLEAFGKVSHFNVKEKFPENAGSYDLVVIGSPTRAFNPSETTSQYLKTLKGKEFQGVKAAAFDTRMEEEDIDSGFLKFMMNTAGFAAKKILKRLERRGGMAVSSPEGFIVKGEKGPLKEDELERAASWARQLISH